VTKDLMFKDEIQQLVRDAYLGLATPGGPARRFYDPDQLARLPDDTQAWALGVGNPLPAANLQPGEVVVDLGSGAGADTMLAAMQVAPDGRASGGDMLDTMVERATTAAHQAGIGNAVFVEAEMEDLPLPDESVDVVISNGSINLAARKSRVLAEAFRVLRPGGRLAVTDLTIREEELPAEILTHPSAWAG
jgi:arsenite methyltransferase